MKPLNFPSLFLIFLILFSVVGLVINIEYILEGEFAVSIFIGIVSIISALILAFLTLKIRATDKTNTNRLSYLYFILCSWQILTMFIFIIFSNSAQLTILKSVIFLALIVLSGLFGAKVLVRGQIQHNKSQG